MGADEEDLVEVWIGGHGNALQNMVQKGSPLGEEEPDPGVERNYDNSLEQGYGVSRAAVLFSHFLWLLFLMGFLCPLIWMVVVFAGGCTCRNKRIRLAQLTASDRAAWLASTFMACASVAIILGCSIYYISPRAPDLESAAPTGVATLGPYFFSVVAPAGSLSKAPAYKAAASVAQAFHAAMALPDSYPVKHVKAELMQTPGSSVVPASSLRHLREDSNSASPSTHDSAIPAKQPATHHVGPELFMRYLLQQPDETGAALPQPEPFITVVWAISLQSSPDIPEAAAMQQRVTAEYAANDLVFQLAVVGYVDIASMAFMKAGFAVELAHALEAANTTLESAGPAYPADEALLYPPPPIPEAACVGRLKGSSNTPVMGPCASPWSANGTHQVPQALTIADGVLVEKQTGKPAQLRGINWHGWNSDQIMNVDGLWAWQDGDIPDLGQTPISSEDKAKLDIGWLGKRTMTNDFATVVHRIKMLGFNTIRLQFVFKKLNSMTTDVYSAFHTCLKDKLDYIGINKTLDPKLLEWLETQRQLAAATAAALAAETSPNGTAQSNETVTVENVPMAQEQFAEFKARLPPYTGMPHPPPASNNSECDGKPWSAPFLSTYGGPLHPLNSSGNLELTQCNYYLPAGPAVAGIHRFLWQIQYLVSQGFYVVLDFNSQRGWEPNMIFGQLLGRNWGNLWRMLTELPEYKEHLAGRVFPDLANEPSRWNCQWESASYWRDEWTEDGVEKEKWCPRCAPIIQSFGMAAATIWRHDPHVPVMVNGLGQNRDPRKDTSGGNYESMSWGDGFITDKALLVKHNLSDPSPFLATVAKMAGPGVVLAPHLYPPSITRNPPEELETNKCRWDRSWGLKMQGLDKTSQGVPLPKLPVIVGEISAYDQGLNAADNTDTTRYSSSDKAWLSRTAQYLKSLAATSNQGSGFSWLLWCWNANSHDTKGVVGPETTWREVQWIKVRMLIKKFDLTPWYCQHYPAFCQQVDW